MAEDTASRREFIKAVGAGALTTGIGANVIIPRRAHAAQRTLKILQWVHFVPAYDEWFNETYVKGWGKRTTLKLSWTISTTWGSLLVPRPRFPLRKGTTYSCSTGRHRSLRNK